MDVTYAQTDAGTEAELIDRVVSTLSEDSGLLRCSHGDRLVVLYARVFCEPGGLPRSPAIEATVRILP